MPAAATDENARYKRALRTAEELFKKVGFRAATMELVAREADVAKAAPRVRAWPFRFRRL